MDGLRSVKDSRLKAGCQNLPNVGGGSAGGGPDGEVHRTLTAAGKRYSATSDWIMDHRVPLEEDTSSTRCIP